VAWRAELSSEENPTIDLSTFTEDELKRLERAVLKAGEAFRPLQKKRLEHSKALRKGDPEALAKCPALTPWEAAVLEARSRVSKLLPKFRKPLIEEEYEKLLQGQSSSLLKKPEKQVEGDSDERQ